MKHPKEMKECEIESFLSYLAVQRFCSKSTQRTALNAIVFLFKSFMQRDNLGEVYLPHASKLSNDHQTNTPRRHHIDEFILRKFIKKSITTAIYTHAIELAKITSPIDLSLHYNN